MQPDPSIDVLVIEDLGQQRLPARRLVAVLRRAGMSAQLAHFGAGDDPAGIVALARREQPRLIVLSILFAHLVAENLSLAAYLHTAGITAHITMVGSLPTFAYAALLEACPALDSVLCGEAEASLTQLATGLPDLGDWHSVPGLAYRSPALCTNPLPRPVSDLDELPFPARDDGISTRLGFGFVTLEASRGCYHACAFCLPCAFYRAHTAPAYRLRSIPHLVAEIEALYQRGVRLFLFDDEQFLAPGRRRTQRIQALADQLERRGLDIAFSIKCRADDVAEVLFRQLKAMGLVRVYLGIESGCQASLNLLDKGITADCNARALALLDKLGIVADFRCLLFHPWSALEMIQADVEFLEQVLPHVSTPFTFHEVECYPGTPLAERLRAEGARSEERGKDARRPSAHGCFERFDKDFRLIYTIADRRAELLRRLGRVVFRVRNMGGGIPSQLSQAWYDILLERRFRPDRFAASKALTLKDITTRLNRESLAVWREMLSFAGEGDLYDAGRVNEQASGWASRVNAFDLTIEEELF
jgi:anaerobic magnesium-protoporphyrin IX monomethyl ester cyclase